VNSPEQETVTLINTADRDIDLGGWAIADKNKNKFMLSGSIGRGAAMLVPIARPAELSNRGGIVSLLNASGVKIHGVSYTREQARTPGLTIVF